MTPPHSGEINPPTPSRPINFPTFPFKAMMILCSIKNLYIIHFFPLVDIGKTYPSQKNDYLSHTESIFSSHNRISHTPKKFTPMTQHHKMIIHLKNKGTVPQLGGVPHAQENNSPDFG